MRVLRAIIGLFFVATGAFKLFGSMGDALPAGPAGFAAFLEAAGVPLPMLNAWLVCAVEIGCGAVLLASVVVAVVRSRPLAHAAAAVVLAVDMCVAIATVGVRAQRGDPVMVEGVPTASEPWRLALEVVVLALLVVIAVASVRATLRKGAR